ncbi:MAG: hypothetical protein K2L77_09400 [Muribaculaceae bacterium]|nr:hypothetical protein [Muribaculaceae bacterium]
MIYKQTLIPFYLLVSILLGSCNNDIFIDGPAVPDENLTVIENADGGTVSFTIPVKGLQSITFDRMSNSRYCTYYNKAGDVVSEKCPASDLAKIVYEGIQMAYQIDVDGKRLRFTSMENCSGRDVNVTVRLEYDYATKFLYIKILPGSKWELDSIGYDGPMMVVDDVDRRVSTMRISNSGPLPQIFRYKPYLNVRPTAVVSTDDVWLKYEMVDMSLPEFVDGQWSMIPHEQVTIGVNKVLGFDKVNEEAIIEVPAGSSVKAVCTVIISRAVTDGTITFRNPVSGRLHAGRFSCETYWPTSYTITVEDDEDDV